MSDVLLCELARSSPLNHLLLTHLTTLICPAWRLREEEGSKGGRKKKGWRRNTRKWRIICIFLLSSGLKKYKRILWDATGGRRFPRIPNKC